MIVVTLIGGLGNQMFQYALGRKLSIQNNQKLLLDLSFLKAKAEGYTQRNFELNVFNIQADIASDAELKKFKPSESRILRKLYKFFPNLNQNKIIREKGHHFQNELLNMKGNCLYYGFWQSEKYFKEIRDILQADFTPKNNPSAINFSIIDKINSSNSISLHVRRGDYVQLKDANNFHGVCGLDYYTKAIENIKNSVTNPEFFIFSDDFEWCKTHLKIDYPTHFIENNSGANSFEDIRLMSLCKHNIVANSSFSWWGAWLNKNKEKIVIAPSQWFQNNTIDTKDLIPENWIKL